MIPESLKNEIAEQRCVLFVGAGCSAGCKSKQGDRNPPDWAELLTALLPLADEDDRSVVIDLIRDKQYLDAAEILLSNRNEAEFASTMSRLLDEPEYAPSETHKNILRLDPKIIVTTNFDTLLEECAREQSIRDYRICNYYDDSAIDILRSKYRLLYKVHGTIEKPHMCVLSRSHYFEAKKEYTFSYRVLDALFMTSTVLFLGCSLDDPDIKLVLENAQIAVPSRHPHYAIVPEGKHRAMVSSIKRSYNIELLTYPCQGGDHSAFHTAISDLADEIESMRA